jgi:hypothetical protein
VLVRQYETVNLILLAGHRWLLMGKHRLRNEVFGPHLIHSDHRFPPNGNVDPALSAVLDGSHYILGCCFQIVEINKSVVLLLTLEQGAPEGQFVMPHCSRNELNNFA